MYRWYVILGLLFSLTLNGQTAADELLKKAWQAYELEDWSASKHHFEKAISLAPSRPDLKRHYAGALEQQRKWRQALEVIESIASEQIVLDDQLQAARLHFWLGQLDESRKALQGATTLAPGHEAIARQYKEIEALEKSYLTVQESYQTDDQPMQSHRQLLSYQRYQGAHSHWQLNLVRQDFRSQGENSFETYRLDLGNQHQWTQEGIGLKYQLGGLHWQQTLNLYFLGELNWDWSAHWRLKASHEYDREFFNQLSLFEGLSPYAHTSNFSLQRHTEFGDPNGEIVYQIKQYQDGNTVDQAYAWYLYDFLSMPQYKLYLGYSMVYANARASSFKPWPDPEGNWQVDERGSIAGFYEAYFSPHQQLTHHLLAGFQIPLGTRISLGAKISRGWGEADFPYLYQDLNEDQEIIWVRDFYRDRYQPWEYQVAFGWQISSSWALELNYLSQSLLNYRLNRGEISLNYVW